MFLKEACIYLQFLDGALSLGIGPEARPDGEKGRPREATQCSNEAVMHIACDVDAEHMLVVTIFAEPSRACSPAYPI